MRLSGSHGSPSLKAPVDFKLASQIEAMQPMVNSKMGPSLVLTQEFPYPKYSTISTIFIGHNEEKIITVTFLSKDASTMVCKCNTNGGVTAFCSPLLTRQSEEVWLASVTVRGYVPFGLESAAGSVFLEITGYQQTIEVKLDFIVNRLSINTEELSSQIPSGRSRQLLTTPYAPPATAERVQTFTPGRHHSPYVYDPSMQIPADVKDEIHRSIMSASVRKSQLASPPLKVEVKMADYEPQDFVEPVKQTPSAARPKLNTDQMNSAMKHYVKMSEHIDEFEDLTVPKIKADQLQGAAKSYQKTGANILDQLDQLPEKEQQMPKIKAQGLQNTATSYQKMNNIMNQLEELPEPDQAEMHLNKIDKTRVEENKDELDLKNQIEETERYITEHQLKMRSLKDMGDLVEAVKNDEGQQGVSIKVTPGCVVFKACAPTDYQLAKVRVKNTSGEPLTVKLSIEHRSFAAPENCQFGDISTDISVIQFVVDESEASQQTLMLKVDETADVTLQFKPVDTKRPLVAAKLIFGLSEEETYQIPILGVQGHPDLTVKEKDGEIVVHNSGSAPAFIVFGDDIKVAEVGQSVELEARQGSIQWGNQHLKMLLDAQQGDGDWAELWQKLDVDENVIGNILQGQMELIDIEKK